MKKKVIILILLGLIITACTNNSKNDNEESDNQAETEPMFRVSETTVGSYRFFDTTINEEDNEVVIRGKVQNISENETKLEYVLLEFLDSEENSLLRSYINIDIVLASNQSENFTMTINSFDDLITNTNLVTNFKFTILTADEGREASNI